MNAAETFVLRACPHAAGVVNMAIDFMLARPAPVWLQSRKQLQRRPQRQLEWKELAQGRDYRTFR
jgi:hypothetical protein